MLEHTNFKTTSIEFPGSKYFIFAWGGVSIWTCCLSFIKNLYYTTHRIASYIHKLINDPLDKIYVNFEQKRSSASTKKLRP